MCGVFNVPVSWSTETSSLKSGSLCASPLSPPKKNHGAEVVFLNPGESSDKGTGDFWLNVSKAMQSAADDFGMSLEILYADRDQLLAQQQADEVLARNLPPDFLVIVNEKMIAEPIIRKANAKGVRTLLILNGFSDRQQLAMGKPREKFPCWIGELIPDNRKAGYMLAKQLTDQIYIKNPQVKNINILALIGDYVTQASRDREKGLQDFLAENPTVQLKHRYVGLWNQQRAEKIVMAALQKNIDIDVIWSANDAMALGALSAIKQQSRRILVGGINWDASALQKLAKNELSVDVGGHFILGGWALVLLNDYSKGRDFAFESLSFKPEGFSVLTATAPLQNFSGFPQTQINAVDFLSLSKGDKSQQLYRFDVNQLWSKKDGLKH